MALNKMAQLGSAFFRLSSLAFRFIFMMLVIKTYSFGFMGVYNIINGYITLLVYIAGIEFYYFANRKTALIDSHQKSELLLTQATIYCFNHCILFIPTLIYFNIRLGLGILVILMLLTSHFNLEIYRALFGLKKPVAGALVSSLGIGLWTLPIMAMILQGHPPGRSSNN